MMMREGSGSCGLDLGDEGPRKPAAAAEAGTKRGHKDIGIREVKRERKRWRIEIKNRKRRGETEIRRERHREGDIRTKREGQIER